MDTTVGIFQTRAQAENAARELRRCDVPLEHIQLLLPETAEADIRVLPTEETEQPGVAKAIGGTVGAAVGATAGLGIGAAAASLLVPGVGAVTAVGLAAAALLGTTGAIEGARAAGKFEEKTEEGLPKDEVYLYRDALTQGHAIVFVMADTQEEADRAKATMEKAGAESLDAAREKWWVGIREPEKEHYEEGGRHFAHDEKHYRRGFVAALHPETHGKPYERIPSELRQRYPDSFGTDAFRKGFERGALHGRETYLAPQESRSERESKRG
jgi:hypothetical protein